ncbi:hypothetical protein LEP1GSC075_0057, partial [Leptospira interrogans str. Kito]
FSKSMSSYNFRIVRKIMICGSFHIQGIEITTFLEK